MVTPIVHEVTTNTAEGTIEQHVQVARSKSFMLSMSVDDALKLADRLLRAVDEIRDNGIEHTITTRLV